MDPNRVRRDRQLRRGTVAHVLARLSLVAVKLVTVPIGLSALGAEGYGLWLAISGSVAWLGLADMGVAAGLVSKLSEAMGKDDRGLATRYVSTALTSVALTGGLVLVILLGARASFDLSPLWGLKTGSTLVEAADAVVLVAIVTFAAQFVLGPLVQVAAGLQRTDLTGAASILANGLTLAATFVAWKAGFGIVAFAAFVGAVPLLAPALVGAAVFRRNPDLVPSLGNFRRALLPPLLGTGGFVLVLQLNEIAMNSVARVAVAHFSGTAEVATYAVTFSMLNAIISLAYGFMAPMWPAITEAYSRGDTSWAKRRLLQNSAASVGLTWLGLAFVLVLGRWIIGVWAGPSVVPSQAFLAAMCGYFAAWALDACASVGMLGIQRFGTRALIAGCGTVGILVSTWTLGGRGPVWIALIGAGFVLLQAIVSWVVILRGLTLKAEGHP